MTELKCPFCQQPIVCMDAQDADEHSTWYCPRCIAEKAWYAFGNKALWQALIDTKKKLDIARHTIGWINQMIDEHADKQAIKIKCEYALEQIKDNDKDVK